MINRLLISRCILALVATICLSRPAPAQEPGDLTTGQTVYVSAYSHIYSGAQGRPFLLAVTLSIRNVDPDRGLRVTSVDYHDTAGKRLHSFLEGPVTLGPLASVRYIIPENDRSGGSGANFMVCWEADQPVNPPIIETVMIGTKSGQGISFTSRGRAIRPSSP